ncbi:MAG: chromophore lyase CpcT/CpeT [Deltaproteobacteria bacterium]|nr:chromophore lyase CpcT/CpeT [Deltaproteobacteria bacterium]
MNTHVPPVRSSAAFAVLFAVGALACGGSSDADGSSTSATSGSGGVGGAGGAEPLPTPSAADRAFAMLTGRFDSKEQAEVDPEYYAVQLQTCVVDAPALGERVLYVEQALMTKLGAPYRQRLYVISPVAGSTTRVTSDIYDLKAPKQAVGLCDAEALASFEASDAIKQDGCTVGLEFEESAQRFVGGTDGKACKSTLNGASYVTSEVVLDENIVESWDRGYDESDSQVWGAVAGAYRFVRRTPLAP